MLNVLKMFEKKILKFYNHFFRKRKRYYIQMVSWYQYNAYGILDLI